VLAFACGAGVEAVAAAKAGAAEVWASDLDPVALIAAEMNAAANGVVLRTTAANLLDGPADGAPAAFDLILAGDAAYERPEADRLSRWLRAQVRAGAEALVGDAGRGFLDLSGWERIATYEVPTPRDLEDRPSRSAAVWRVRGD
jgi:predicted nicotinamide N-methyase